ncbi:DUF2634 domain-containing protein [Pelosinus sp. IPA-1]|uniref:DUF2634 domain-containing protein n=1 Tax=Pelosinus sp. IPA-1 TaxID=3029569 RepID=UPI00243629F5|nr:DUF2634 domain-containing protein [Pelosinus sp. IPA-1]GMB01080.1 hypothetical protein PIPA1_38790 [Pelosinus sp. IPA-1]
MANPFVGGNITGSTTESDTLPTFTEYAWDFEHDCFIFENGKHKIVIENEALKVWIYKTLKTERWRYRAYDGAYGIELEQFIGKSTNNADSSVEVEMYVKEALLTNPYIKSIDDVTFTNESDVLDFEVSLTTVYGNLTVQS